MLTITEAAIMDGARAQQQRAQFHLNNAYARANYAAAVANIKARQLRNAQQNVHQLRSDLSDALDMIDVVQSEKADLEAQLAVAIALLEETGLLN